MLMLPVTLMMLFLLLISILMILSSSSMFSMWLALEINTISFTTIIHMHKTQESSESCIKYFLPQALGSSIFVFSMLFISLFPNSEIPTLSSLFAMAIKLGLPPFHHWFPNVASKIPWHKNIMLMTLQKIPPLFIIFHLSAPTYSILPFIFSSLLLGPIGGLNQTNLKQLLAFSSITHMGWMLSSYLLSNLLCFMYLTMYSFLISSLILSLKMKINSLNQLMLFSQTSSSKILFVFLLLSLAGLPPLTGFFPKWLVITMTQNPFITMMLIISAILNLFFYLRLLYPFLFLHSPFMFWIPPQMNLKTPILLWGSLFLLPVSMPLTLFFY
uniref:NADH dehydrogenase subunit 2 n=1 Tax=Heterophrynus longicornis TaxID=1046789 RepID=UPI0024116373|nr:NADH dehydrogenase subunit 2 [Heterophrynus longicornis]WEM34670.1 NADH dehydrogenase subunit 2 [Heterophrynus longicornis]